MPTLRLRAPLRTRSAPLAPSAHEPRWRKSSASQREQCLEAAFTGRLTLIRDSQHPDDAVLDVPAREWVAFLAGLRPDT